MSVAYGSSSKTDRLSKGMNMSTEAVEKFYEYTYGTDDPNIQYVVPDGHAPSVAIQFDGVPDVQEANVAEVLVSANDDFGGKVIEGVLFMNAAQLRKLGQDALRAAEHLDARRPER